MCLNELFFDLINKEEQMEKLAIRGREFKFPIVQGGMGVGISHVPLISAVVKNGGIGTLSTAFIDAVYYKEYGKRKSLSDCVEFYVREAKRLSGGFVAINAMVHLNGFPEVVRGAIAGGVDIIFMGAGLPLSVPEIIGNTDVALVPIVSSGRAAKIICEKWKRYQRKPDAFVLEGPRAGGHLGFSPEEIVNPRFSLEEIYGEVRSVAENYGIPIVIVAGGIWSREDVEYWLLERKADGCQLGTRFLATKESGASELTKNMLVKCLKEDIVVAHEKFGIRQSPVGMPFRILKNSPGMSEEFKNPNCRGCPVNNEKIRCRAITDPKNFFCIGTALLSTIRLEDSSYSIITVGANAYRIKEKGIQTVEEVFADLVW